MNIRDHINTSSRPYVVASLVWVLALIIILLVAGIWFGVEERHISLWLILPNVIVIVALTWRATRLIRCPNCSKSLSGIPPHGSLMRISSEIVYCPYCGLNLNESYPSEANHSLKRTADINRR